MLTREDLYPFQERLASFFKTHPNSAGWAEVGLGKTPSTLTAIVDMMDDFEVHRVLVVAPLRVARSVWSEEVARWEHLQHLKVSRIVGNERKRLAAINTKADVYTINYENMRWLEEQFIQEKKQFRPWPWDLVVLDEAHAFKSQSSQRWKSLRKLRRLFPRMIQLTGTPIPNGYADLWSQVFLLDRGQRLGSTETAFRERWFSPPGYGQFDWKINAGSDKQIQEAVSDIVISMRTEDYLDLPPVTLNFIRVDLPELARTAYVKMERHLITKLVTGTVVTAANEGVLYQKLLQLANGAIYVDGDKGRYENFHNEKTDALAELLDNLGRKALIVYSFRHDQGRIADVLGKTGKRWEILESDETKDRWNAGELDYLLLHPRSAGAGLNLQFSGAENVVWFGLTPNLGDYEQCNGRLAGGIRREGKNIIIHHITANSTVDDEVIPLLGKKGATQADLKAALAARWDYLNKGGRKPPSVDTPSVRRGNTYKAVYA